MNTGENYCSCGALLKAGESVCPKCLLAAGLGKSTIVPSEQGTNLPAAEQVTLPPTRSSTHALWQSEHDDDDGVVAGYRDLEAMHDWSGGTVFKAYHSGLDRRVRLRVLESSADAETRREFLSRAEKLSRINHPHTVSILEAGQQDGSAFVAEEWVDGRPIEGFLPRRWKERWREGFFPNDDLLRDMRDAALGLAAIHRTGLVHGHLSPDSLILDRNETVRLIGLETAADASDDRFAPPDGHKNQTVGGDIHRLAAVFFFLTTGVLPLHADPELRSEILARKMLKWNAGLRRGFCQVVADCLDERTRRIETAEDLAKQLNRLLELRVTRATGRARGYSMILEGFGLLVVVGLIAQALGGRLENAGSAVMVVWLVPLIYITAFETIVGWTPVRRFFGIRLLNHAGDRFSWPRRLARALMKLGVLLLMFVMPALVVPLISLTNMHFAANVVITTSVSVMPLLLLCFAAWSIPSHWYLYDLLAGVTWAEQTRVAGDALISSRAAEAARETPEIIARADQYEIYATLGEGGMGQVFRAHDRILDRDVAIKTLVGHLMDDPVLLERFQREARLAAKVSHNNVAKVYGTGIWNDTPYIAMELIDGRNLQDVIRQSGPLPLETAWNYIVTAAEALAAAERSGVVHRDIKPANLMITRDGQLKVTDFGVSRPTQVDTSVTEVGTIVGTPAYMAPEQAMGKDVDCRSDIYALGMTLYHLLTGRPPFQGSSVVEILAQQMEENPPSLLDQVKKLTLVQNDVFLKMIAKKPDQRYANYHELLADLKQFAPGLDRLASPAKRIAAELCNVAAFYFIFTMLMSSLFLLGRGFGLTNAEGTLIVGWTMAAMFTLFVGMYVVMTSRFGATPGKRILAIQVTDVDGRPIGYLRSLVRFLAAFPLLWMLVPIAAFLVIDHSPFPYFRYLVWIAMSLQGGVLIASMLLLWLHPRRRTVHDLAAGTVVMRGAS